MDKPSRNDSALRLHPLAAAVLCASASMTTVSAQAEETTVAADGAIELQTLSVRSSTVSPGGEVSSPKFTAPLRDTPQTVQVIPQEVFSQQGAQSLTDVLSNTPGISFNAGENGFATNSNNFSLRGFDTSGSIFVDGVRDSGNYARDVFNVEQVEVAKGPAGDNGRGGAGGYVNMVTKTPKLAEFGSVNFSYGLDEYESKNRQRTTLDYNTVVAEGTAVRMNVLAQDGGVAGRSIAEKNSLGIAPSVAFGLDTDTRVIFALQHLRTDDIPDWGIPAAAIKGMAGRMPYDPTWKPDPDLFYGLISDFDETESTSVSARVEYDLSDAVTVSNQTKWYEVSHKARFTAPHSSPDAVYGSNNPISTLRTETILFDRRNQSLSNQTNLSGRFEMGGLQHSVSAGLEISRETSKANRYPSGNTTTGIYPNPYRPGPAAIDFTPGTGMGIDPTQTNDVTIDTLAVYVYDTVTLNDQWQVTGGLRAESYEAKIKSRDAVTGAPLANSADGYKADDTTLSGKLGVVFKPADNGTIYASVGLASLPPGSWLSNPDISRTGNNAFPSSGGQSSKDSKTQQSLNLEIGTKWELVEDRLSVTGALFQTERRNIGMTGRDRSSDPSDPVALKGYGKQIVQGLELSAAGQVTPQWSVFGGLVLMESERKHSAELDRMRCEASPGDYQEGLVEGDFAQCTALGLSARGDELAFSPKVSANLWTTYEVLPGLNLGGGVRYVGSSYLGRPDDADRIIPNGVFGKLPSYTVIDLVASYDVSPNLNLRLNIDNVADELYATSANWPGQRVEIGTLRSYLLSANFKF